MRSEDYITQHFPPRPNRGGAKENADAYNTRMYWFKNNFPKYQEVADAFGFKFSRVRGYADKYNWKEKREKYEELQDKEDAKKRKQKQKKWENNIHKGNELIFNVTLKQMQEIMFKLNYLPDNPNPNYDLLTAKEKELLEDKLDRLEDKLISLQPKLRTNLHLTNNYTDRQINENITKIDGGLVVEHTVQKSFEEEMQEYEDYFEQLESERQSTDN